MGGPGEGLDPFEYEEWVIVSFTDPRDGTIYDIIDGRVIVAFIEYPELPMVDPNYFDEEIDWDEAMGPLDPFYSVEYGPSQAADPEIAAFLAAENLTIFSEWPEVGALAAVLPEGQTVLDAVANWPAEYPDLIEEVDPDAIVPDDTWPQDDPDDDRFPQQWNVNENESNPLDNPYHINIQEAWRHYQFGHTYFVVAVLDTGVDYDLADLQWRTTSRGCNTGDKRKASTSFNYRSLGGGEPWDWLLNWNANTARGMGHGTCVAGIISAHINNDPGFTPDDDKDIAGIAYYTRYFPVAMKYFRGAYNNQGGFSDSAILNAYSAIGAVKRIYNPKWLHNIDVPYYMIEVVNASYGKRKSTPAGVRHITNLGRYMLFVCSAGNNGTDEYSVFPASHPFAMSVAAYQSNGNRVASSNYEPYTDIAAPGAAILTSDMYGENIHGDPLGYQPGVVTYFGQTSAAAPHVSAVAAMVSSKYRIQFPVFVRLMITANSAYLPGDLNFCGRLDAYAALE